MRRTAALPLCGIAALGAWLGCNQLLGLDEGTPLKGTGGGSAGSASGTESGSGTASSGSGASSESGAGSGSSASSGSGGCTQPADGGGSSCSDHSWAHWNPSAGPSYADITEATVTDKTTGLMWQRVHGEQLDWPAAKKYCLDLELAGHCDWRLPTRIELTSIVDYAKATGPLIDLGAFPNTPPNGFWTASANKQSAGAMAWFVNFNEGHVVANRPIEQPLPVRCVR